MKRNKFLYNSLLLFLSAVFVFVLFSYVNAATTGNGSITITVPAGFNSQATVNVTVQGTYNSGQNNIASNTIALTVNPVAQYALNVSKSGAGAGTVSSSPSGISCGGTCSANYDSGASVILTATPNAGSTFGGWSGACTNTTGTCSVTMSSAKSVTANFNSSSVSFNVTIQGDGSGNVAATGINCTTGGAGGGTDCSENYASGTSLTLTAAPSTGSAPATWVGCTPSGGNQCTVTVTSTANLVTATFNKIGTPTLSLDKLAYIVGETGTLTISYPVASLGNKAVQLCSTKTVNSATTNNGCSPYTPNTSSTSGTWTKSVTFTSAEVGSWTEYAILGASPSATNSNTLNFTVNHRLTVTKAGTGSGTVASTGINCGTNGSACTVDYYLNSNTGVSLTATVGANSTFAGWSGACSGTGACSLTMSANKNVTATFNANPTAGGACGSADGRSYPYGSSSYSPYSQCSIGTPSTTSFPSANSNTTWTCTSNSISSACSASQQAAGATALSCSPDVASVPVNTAVTFNPSGGSGSPYAWTTTATGASSTSSSNTSFNLTFSSATPSTKTVSVTRGGSAPATCSVTVTPAGSPDLIVSDIRLSASSGGSVKSGFKYMDIIYPSVTIKNVGTASTPDGAYIYTPFYLRPLQTDYFYFQSGGGARYFSPFDFTAFRLTVVQDNPPVFPGFSWVTMFTPLTTSTPPIVPLAPLAPGESRTFNSTFNGTMKPFLVAQMGVLPGNEGYGINGTSTYEIAAMVDQSNAISESNETNNKFTLPYCVGGPNVCNSSSTPISGSWGAWSACGGASCGQTGTQTRTCTPPQNGGTPCSSIDGGNSSQSCTMAACAVTATANIQANGLGSLSIFAGQPVTLTWSSTVATSCSGTNFTVPGGATSGSAPIVPPPPSTVTYTVTCGTATASVTVTVAAAPVPGSWSAWGACGGASCGQTGTQTRTCTPPQNGGTPCSAIDGGNSSQSCTMPACVVNASANIDANGFNPASIFTGQPVTINWSSTNATSCSGTNFIIPGNTPSGSVAIVPPPPSTVTYTVTCGTATASVLLTVKNRPGFIEN